MELPVETDMVTAALTILAQGRGGHAETSAPHTRALFPRLHAVLLGAGLDVSSLLDRVVGGGGIGVNEIAIEPRFVDELRAIFDQADL